MIEYADLEKHNTEVRNKAIDEFKGKLVEQCENMMKEEWNSHVHPTSWASAYAEFKEDVEEIAEQLKGANVPSLNYEINEAERD